MVATDLTTSLTVENAHWEFSVDLMAINTSPIWQMALDERRESTKTTKFTSQGTVKVKRIKRLLSLLRNVRIHNQSRLHPDPTIHQHDSLLLRITPTQLIPTLSVDQLPWRVVTFMARTGIYMTTQLHSSAKPQQSQPSAQPGLGAGLTTEVTEEVVLFIVTAGLCQSQIDIGQSRRVGHAPVVGLGRNFSKIGLIGV